MIPQTGNRRAKDRAIKEVAQSLGMSNESGFVRQAGAGRNSRVTWRMGVRKWFCGK